MSSVKTKTIFNKIIKDERTAFPVAYETYFQDIPTKNMIQKRLINFLDESFSSREKKIQFAAQFRKFAEEYDEFEFADALVSIEGKLK